MQFLHITDTHFTSSSNTRVGDYAEDLFVKLEYFVEKCNALKAVPLHSGDFNDKPSVPDYIKSRLISILKKLWTPLLCITGNHDRLYGSDERFYRTSLSVLAEAGVLRIINNRPVEFDDCYVVPISTTTPLIPRSKPQIALGHGFLNQEDGLNTVYFQDIQSDDYNLIILGHDHMPYAPIPYRNTTILRPGSFARGIRTDSADRIPVMIHIRIHDGKPQYRELPIEVAKPVELLFREKVFKVTKSEVSYESLIEQMKRTSSDDTSLENLLKMVADEETVQYISEHLNEISLNKNK